MYVTCMFVVANAACRIACFALHVCRWRVDIHHCITCTGWHATHDAHVNRLIFPIENKSTRHATAHPAQKQAPISACKFKRQWLPPRARDPLQQHLANFVPCCSPLSALGAVAIHSSRSPLETPTLPQLQVDLTLHPNSGFLVINNDGQVIRIRPVLHEIETNISCSFYSSR